MRLYLKIVLIVLAAAFTVNAATIDKVVVKGNKRVPDEKVLEKAVQVGSEFDLAEIDKSIGRLYKTGLFVNIKVDLKVTEKVIVTYIVEEKPFINDIYFEGNEEIDRGALLEKLSIAEGDVFEKPAIENAVKTIKAEYQDRNYYNVNVNFSVEQRPDNTVDIIFTIDEGKEAKVEEIKFYGNDNISDDKLEDIIQTSEKGFFSWFTGSGKLKSQQLALDRQRIRATYLNNGYIQAKVGKPEVIYNEDKTEITLVFRIQEGKQYHIGEIRFEGNEHRTDEYLRKVITLKEGDLFKSEKFQKDIESLTKAFTKIGYAYANVNPSTSVNESTRKVNITYKITENNLYYINKIKITGNTKTRDRVIRRQFDIVEKDKYDSLKIQQSKKQIEYLNYFEQVKLVEDRVDNNSINLNLSVNEKPTGMFTIGAGYSSLDGAVGMIQVSQKNLLGYGYDLSLKSEFSSKRTDYTLSFTNQWLFDRPISFGFDLYKFRRSYYEYTKDSTGGALRIGHPIIKRKLNMYYRFAYEKVDITSIDDDASQYIRDQKGITTTVSFTPKLVWNTLNHPVDPTRGNKSSLFVKYADTFLGGDSNFYKAGIESSQYVPLWWKFVGMLHGEAGYMESLDDKKLPIDERYRLGGMHSVRGFDYGDISPVDENGYEYGGNKFLLFNAELIFPLSEASNLKGVLFYDTGQVYDNDENYFEKDMRSSVGFGFRWFSPIGPLRLEYGYKLDKKKDEEQAQWDFSIGGTF
ncbi:outer membrane protein assembly factor BamA [Flexistipes sinusarabici]|uniref:outer membrane protein assembly factor BamA n=1 Tax=Flexistipes sinusarabici TaxID=2352 RepID=UPI00235720BB|nr:outer membrane protein assembly factor BamA [Flexistipes sinusarabici]